MSSVPVYDCVIGYPLVAIGSGAILLSVLGMRSRDETRWWKTLLYLGQISYGLYVFHVMIMTMFRRAIAPENGSGVIIFAVASLAMTIVVSALSYKYYETPFLRLKSRFASVPSGPGLIS